MSMEYRTKKEIRRAVKERRQALTKKKELEDSRQILAYVVSLPEYEAASCVYCYVDYNHEVQTWPIMEQAIKDGKRVAVPRVDGTAMDFYYIASREDLEAGYFGIMEPKHGLPMAKERDALFLMPGVAFDRAHHRVGYGGGFYDRYLERMPELKTVALAYECQMFDEVPFEAFDIRPSVLVTEAGISRL